MSPKSKASTNGVTPTTTQALGSLLKSARDIMRKDKGLNGDLDRLPLLTWIMFLKFLDDLEMQREDEAAVGGKKFRPAIEAPYRWRDWASNPQGVTGDELLAFINQDEAVLPDGRKGPGLFAYLRHLTSSNGDDRRDVIARVFAGVDNRMKSGYLLKDVINKVAGIHFTSSDELHTLGALYESMLREMRDAAGDSGEFYTPRPVVRFMVEMIDPRLGETILDPAAGTGGFRVSRNNGYSVRRLDEIADFLDGRRVPLSESQRSSRKGKYPYYGASGIIDHIDDYIFDEPLLLLSEDGANLLNRSTPIAFVATGKYWVNNHAHVLRPLPGVADLHFLAYALSDFDVSVFNFASAQPKLNQKNARTIAFPLPPINEQRRIVTELNTLQAEVDATKSLQTQTASELNSLLPSILDRAFSGEF
jgi:hypothetical protein